MDFWDFFRPFCGMQKIFISAVLLLTNLLWVKCCSISMVENEENITLAVESTMTCIFLVAVICEFSISYNL